MSNEVEEALRAMESRLDAARVSGDVALFDEVLGVEFQTTSPAGALSAREQMLEDVRSGALKVRSSQSTDITVHSYGATAIVRGRAALKAAFQGHDISGVYAYTHVYMLRDGRWQVVAAHTSRRMPDWFFLVLNRLHNLFRLTRK